AETPEYLSLEAGEIPKKDLHDNSGWIKVIAGEYEDLSSGIPNYMKQFLFHIHLEGGKQFSVESEQGTEYAAFLPLHNVMINGAEHHKGEFIEFDRDKGVIEIDNPSGSAIDIILFGGEHYSEPIVAQGPFVMNTQHEISEAYNDFYKGSYGEIDYSLVK
ncbi:MAG TPA: pirin-like C-terminal cupin domain-containing protein, partial [Chitinophagaceae bacterium]|nr:pirin-like C-terminal cupin domain-containing protein [Chitinophagaceae bacterium]